MHFPTHYLTEITIYESSKKPISPYYFGNKINKFTFSGCVKNLVGNTGSLGESALHKALLLLITHSATSHTV